jgi:hypothetical protein
MGEDRVYTAAINLLTEANCLKSRKTEFMKSGFVIGDAPISSKKTKQLKARIQ